MQGSVSDGAYWSVPAYLAVMRQSPDRFPTNEVGVLAGRRQARYGAKPLGRCESHAGASITPPVKRGQSMGRDSEVAHESARKTQRIGARNRHEEHPAAADAEQPRAAWRGPEETGRDAPPPWIRALERGGRGGAEDELHAPALREHGAHPAGAALRAVAVGGARPAHRCHRQAGKRPPRVAEPDASDSSPADRRPVGEAARRSTLRGLPSRPGLLQLRDRRSGHARLALGVRVQRDRPARSARAPRTSASGGSLQTSWPPLSCRCRRSSASFAAASPAIIALMRMISSSM